MNSRKKKLLLFNDGHWLVVDEAVQARERMLTISNENIEETRRVEILKFSRVLPETSHCQDKEY